ncbi:U2 small nuclear ribonucleoprotein A' [Tetrabaena socialis]|uniref:U2 small nuclear ribonucleoprotein A n=1 Tax=Tetrabaena socialis TaxID=47790 RepID=A0A2J8A6F7_9CHLO|nr:U2 small nuclear ribonucleoprotein A' [Tetrabaena socialis]|eukprot:PNH08090.1 U2 small nuclear ribonucleoprotein A' [Tetrabaena socialis]
MAEARPQASQGPRLPGRITAELIMRSPQYMSCIKLYEIDLRGNKIAAIENLGTTQNQFDSIDLSDNAIVRLDGFPKLLRLKQLLINNNRVARISRGLEESIPNLEVLILSNNRITNLQDLDPLATLSKLEHVSLHGNPVVTKPNYRRSADCLQQEEGRCGVGQGWEGPRRAGAGVVVVVERPRLWRASLQQRAQ